jgi:ABC-type glycerol-3-phosphate transport system substrate-binding protein
VFCSSSGMPRRTEDDGEMMTKASYLRRILLVLTLFALVGCSLFRADENETPAPPVATVRPTAIGTPPGTGAPGAATPSGTPTQEGPVTLVMWTSEDYAPNSETAGGAQLLQQIQAFQQDVGVNVQVILKKRSGTGGLLDFLTTSSAAAPTILPDLITLSYADLNRAAQAGLLQPLDDLVTPGTLDDQFDFALALTQMAGATMGVLYQTDLQHLVFDAALVPTSPLSWQDLYSSTVPFVFSPAPPSEGVNDAILIQYLAAGGVLTDPEGAPRLDLERLTQVLEFFQKGRQQGVIPRSVLDLSDATTAWATFRIGEAAMAQVPASLYLAERAGLSNVSFGPIPLAIPDVLTVGQGWALAIVTQDPERQQLSAALIEHLLAPEQSGAWTLAAGRLPSRNAALDAWGQNDPYVPFVRNLLAHARPAPDPDLATVVGGPLAQSLIEVLSGRMTPAEAAQAAVNVVGAGP